MATQRRAKKESTRKTGATGRRAARKPATRRRVSAIPKGYRTVTPYLVVRGAAQALDFYGRAFGAKEKVRMGMPDGTVMHAELKIGDSMVMLADENLEWGAKSPETLGGSATHVMLYVRDVDAFVARALAAGATVEMPLADMFWGDRYGKLRDPFGHVWSVATHREDVPGREMARRARAFAERMGQGAPPES
jgi:PhnB protein